MKYADLRARHSFIWLGAAVQGGDLRTSGPVDGAILQHWISRGLPTIITRRQPDTDPEFVAAGLALPPGKGRRRIAFSVCTDAITALRPAPALRDIIPLAPPSWHACLDSLAADARAASIDFRVYGSFAWQFLTGLPYITNRSDIDLVWQPVSTADLYCGIAILRRREHESGLWLDGEIILPDGSAVAWREFDSGRRRVLVKGSCGVGLRTDEAILRLYSPGAAAC